MVQPGSAVVIVAASSARDKVAWPAVGPVVSAGTGPSAMTVTWQGLPDVCGAATSMPTSATTRSPGAGQLTSVGAGVATAGPSTRTLTCPGTAPVASGPSPSSVTRTIASGRATVPPNKSVEVTPLIRMPHRCTNPRSRRSLLVESIVSSVSFRNMSSDNGRRPAGSGEPEGAAPPGLRSEARATREGGASEGGIGRRAGRGGEREAQPPRAERPHIEVRDPRMMRALAHPLRVALIEAISQADTRTLTATEASELLGESPANCAFHLRTLAKYGFVEEAGGGRGRERPWKTANRHITISTKQDDPRAATAAGALSLAWLDLWIERARQVFGSSSFLPGWENATGWSRS